jgi:N-acetylglucosamine kinase-like BadF-type ATPase
LAAAGAGRPREREELRRWASARFPNSQIAVTDDAQPILAAASERRVGVALICGTGSFAWGRDAAGRTQRCGGWGHLFGDEGSGYALGVAALRAVAQAADGRGPATSLVQAISARLDLREPSELIGCVYGRPLTRDRIARLSQVVFDQAPRDGVAQSLIEQAAASLAQLVNTLSRKLAFPRTDHRFSATLALAGGVLVHQPRFREALLEHVVPGFTSVRVVPHPVRGALLLAAAM